MRQFTIAVDICPNLADPELKTYCGYLVVSQIIGFEEARCLDGHNELTRVILVGPIFRVIKERPAEFNERFNISFFTDNPFGE